MHAIITRTTWGKSQGEFCKMWNFNPEMINYCVKLSLNPAEQKHTCVGIFMKLIIKRELSLLHVFQNSPFSVSLHWSHLNHNLVKPNRLINQLCHISACDVHLVTCSCSVGTVQVDKLARLQITGLVTPAGRSGPSRVWEGWRLEPPRGSPPHSRNWNVFRGDRLDQLTHARIEEWSNKRTGMCGDALKLNTVAEHLMHTYIRMVTASIRSFFLWYSMSRLRLHK